MDSGGEIRQGKEHTVSVVTKTHLFGFFTASLSSEMRMLLSPGVGRAPLPLSRSLGTCFRGERWEGGQTDLSDFAIFSKSFSLKHPICRGAIFRDSVFWTPSLLLVIVPTCCIHVVLGQFKQSEVHVGDRIKGTTCKENHFCLLWIFHAKNLRLLIYTENSDTSLVVYKGNRKWVQL